MTRAGKQWYVRDYIAGQPRQIWRFTAETATRIGVTNPEGGASTYFKADPGESIWDCMKRLTGWFDPGVTEGQFHEMTLGPAEFYPRMARPIALAIGDALWTPSLEGEKSYVAGARAQLTLLMRKLRAICLTVQPSHSTLHVFGHEIRNLLILAATEAEMHLRGVLKANGSMVAKPNTNQYVKLAEPLKLFDYSVAFHDFPDLQLFRPFAGWDAADPTESLPWYAAYHAVKHNREEEFERGTLQHAFSAVAACLVLLNAQFGPIAFGVDVSVTAPLWPVSDMYIPQVIDQVWTPVNCPDLA